MGRYTGSVCRLCRREKIKLFLKGTKCETDKCPIERRAYPPGDHGKDRRVKEEVVSARGPCGGVGGSCPLEGGRGVVAHGA